MDNGHVSGAPRAHATASLIIDANVEQGLRAGCHCWRIAGWSHLSGLWKTNDISRPSCAHQVAPEAHDGDGDGAMTMAAGYLHSGCSILERVDQS